MLDWLAAHQEMANTLINFGMLLVWLVYLHVFIASYRRQKRANILIAIGAGAGLQSRCLVSNLSQSPIYVRSVLLSVRTTSGIVEASVTEIEDLERWERASDLGLWTRQGPLQPGSLRDMGSFDVMIDHALQKDGAGAGGLDGVEGLELTVVCQYGSEDLLVAAAQTYTIERSEGAVRLRPDSLEPRQIRSRRERAKIKATLDRDL